MTKEKIITTIVFCAIMLVGCGSAESSADTTTISNSSTASSAQGEAANPFDEEYFIPQIEEYIITIQGIRITDVAHEYQVKMLDCDIIDLNLTSITAQGILTDETYSTKEPVTVQYELSYADDGSSCVIVNALAPEEALNIIPAIPVSLENLYNKPISIVNANDIHEEIGILEEYTLELDPDGWYPGYSGYRGVFYVIDSEGKRYVTCNEHTFAYNNQIWKLTEVEYEWAAYEIAE